MIHYLVVISLIFTSCSHPHKKTTDPHVMFKKKVVIGSLTEDDYYTFFQSIRPDLKTGSVQAIQDTSNLKNWITTSESKRYFNAIEQLHLEKQFALTKTRSLENYLTGYHVLTEKELKQADSSHTGYCTFSFPYFSTDKSLVLLNYTYDQGNYGSENKLVIYKKSGSKWKEVTTLFKRTW